MDPREQALATAEWQKLLRQIQTVIDRVDPLCVLEFAEDHEFVRDEYADTAVWILRRLRGCKSEADALSVVTQACDGLWGDDGETALRPDYAQAAAEIWRHFESSPVRPLLGNPQVAPGGPLG